MTAEIAIINRSAVTLAADSAMTLEVRGQEKIYTSADKIFELSLHDPIAIMINNNLEYLGIPLDVAIKKFRTSDCCVRFNSVPEAAAAFFRFLEHELRPDDALQMRHAALLIGPVFQEVRRQYERLLQTLFARFKKFKGLSFHEAFVRVANRHLKRFSDMPVADCFADTSVEQIEALCAAPIAEAIAGTFKHLPLDDDDKKLLTRLGATVLHSRALSEYRTGLVFAGFGRADDFPSLIAYEMDGMIAGKLKKRETHNFVTSRADITADIIPFAQREMVDRFLFGIDPEFESAIQDFLGKVMRQTGESIIDHAPRISKTNRAKLRSKLEESINIALSDMKEKAIPEVKERYKQQISDMVLFMQKPELSNMAEALVNITSVKRKFSAEQETVGGPIDVAVISKSDGFVWVKRKHYFDAALNPRFFSRKFGIPAPTGGKS